MLLSIIILLKLSVINVQSWWTVLRLLLLSMKWYRKAYTVKYLIWDALNLQIFYGSRLVVQLSSPNPMKPGVKSRKEDVVGAAPTGDAPTTSEWSTILLPTKAGIISETWRYLEAKITRLYCLWEMIFHSRQDHLSISFHQLYENLSVNLVEAVCFNGLC